MGAAIGIGLASMGNAFMKSYNDTIERKRLQEIEDEDRAWKKEERDAVRQERTEKAQLKRDLGDAVAPRTTMTGTVTQSDAGQVFSATPENARAMQDTLEAEAELRGGPAPAQQAGYAVTGSMSKGHQIATGAAPEGAADTPDARNERILDAYRKNGQLDKAIQMEESIIGIKAKRMGLQVDEFKFLDQRANRELSEMVPFTPVWHQDAARFLTNNQSSPLKGMNVKATPSQDGATVSMEITGLDGDKKTVWTLPNSEEGWARFMDRAQKADLSVKLAALSDARKQAQEQANKDRDFDLRKSESESNQQYRERLLGIQDSQEKRASETHAKTMAADKIPPAVKEQAALLAEQIKGVGSALNKAMAEGSFDANNPGTQRLLEQQAALGLRYSQLIKPYTPGAGGTADPLGFGGGSASPAPAPGVPAARSTPASVPTSAAAKPAQSATRVTPQSQAARDSDASVILQSEMASAQQRLAAARANPQQTDAVARALGDINALEREMRAKGIPVAGTAMQEAAAPAQQVQPPAPQARPAAAMSQAPSAAPVAPVTPAAPRVSMQAQAQAAAPSVAQILAGPSASPALVSSAQQRAQVIESAAAQVKNAQAAVVQAAKSGDQSSVKAAMDQAAAASAKLREMLAGMNPQQAATVIKAVGLQ